MGKKQYILTLLLLTGILIAVWILSFRVYQKTSVHVSAREKLQKVTATKNENINKEKKKVAITFDDGPDPVYTEKLLDGLQRRGVKATFFLLGKQMEQYPDIVKRMMEEGHEIGCHSYEHLNLGQLSGQNACEQLKKTCNLIYEITGERPDFVRPPYGSWQACLDQDICMMEVLWDVDPKDWATEDTQTIVNRILKDVEEYDIILLHDASESSVEAALQVIDIMEKQGYEFVTVEELVMP